MAVGIEKEYIPNRNIWATSSTNIARGPVFARLNGYKGVCVCVCVCVWLVCATVCVCLYVCLSGKQFVFLAQ